MKTLSLIVAALLASASVARADTLTWRFQNNSPYQAQVDFQNADGSWMWPGDAKAFTLNDGDEHTYNLTCRTGDKISYGAWTTDGNGHIGAHYWGSGPNHDQACEKCVATCGAGDPPLVPLDPSDSGN